MPEHTIAENLSRLVTAKTDIANAITTMGGTVGENDGFEEFPADIVTIPRGGGAHLNSATIQIRNGVSSESDARYIYDGQYLYISGYVYGRYPYSGQTYIDIDFGQKLSEIGFNPPTSITGDVIFTYNNAGRLIPTSIDGNTSVVSISNNVSTSNMYYYVFGIFEYTSS